MRKNILTILKILFFFGIGILLVWLVFRNLTHDQLIEIKRAVAGANYYWVALSLFVGFLSHISRAIRWRMLMVPLGHNPKLSSTFYAVMAGYLANYAFPRLGEVTRCGLLKRYEKIPFSESFGTVIVERIIDIIVMLLLFTLTIWLEFDLIYDFANTNIFIPMSNKFFHLFHPEQSGYVLGIIGLFSALISIMYFLKKRIRATSAIRKIKNVLLGFWLGIKSLKNVKNPLLFIFHSLFIWLMYFLAIYVCFFAFEETKNLTVGTGLALLTFGSFGVIAAPGGIGAYQWIVKEVLVLYFISVPIGIAFGWVVWLAQLLLILILGLLSFVLLPIINKEK